MDAALLHKTDLLRFSHQSTGSFSYFRFPILLYAISTVLHICNTYNNSLSSPEYGPVQILRINVIDVRIQKQK